MFECTTIINSKIWGNSLPEHHFLSIFTSKHTILTLVYGAEPFWISIAQYFFRSYCIFVLISSNVGLNWQLGLPCYLYILLNKRRKKGINIYLLIQNSFTLQTVWKNHCRILHIEHFHWHITKSTTARSSCLPKIAIYFSQKLWNVSKLLQYWHNNQGQR